MAITVVHFIETLGRGGAEVLFCNYINALPARYRSIVVYLKAPNELLSVLRRTDDIICLDYKNKYDVLTAAIKLRKIIQKYNATLVHAHLYWPTIVARIATFRQVPLIFSIHNLITQDAFHPNILSKYLEKASYSKRQTAVFVSQAAYDDYQQHIQVAGKAAVLYNFVGDAFFSEVAAKRNFASAGLKLVTVGNLRPQKDHMFLLRCMKLLKKHTTISLDIYGEGWQREALEAYINTQRLTNVRLLGSEAHVEEKLKQYDVFILASKYEGFCIAMAEAMAVGLPCVVPNQQVLQEVSGAQQIYFEQNNERDFADKLLGLYNNQPEQQKYSAAAKAVAAKYTKAAHIQQLLGIYQQALNPQLPWPV